jgi:hypothetical protein
MSNFKFVGALKTLSTPDVQRPNTMTHTETSRRIMQPMWRPRTQVRRNRRWDWTDVVQKTHDVGEYGENYGISL